MDLTALIRFQIAHSAWALARLIEHARTLPTAKIEENLGIGPGSLRQNIAHTIECMFYFADNFAGLEYVEPKEFAADSKSLDGLSRLLDSAHAKLRLALLRACERGFGETVHWPNAESGTMPAAAAIAQVFDHATLHRAQCVNMLKRLGVNPVPDLDPMTYQGLSRA